MDELEELRQRKLEELKNIQQKEEQETVHIQQQISMLEGIVKRRFSRDALERYGNIRAAHPDKAVQLIAILAQAIEAGQVSTITDADLKEMLKRMSHRRETQITRK